MWTESVLTVSGQRKNGLVNRVVVVGNSGSGKTTVGRKIAELEDVPYLEMDSEFQQPNWQPRPRAEFDQVLKEFVGQKRWVVDGNYASQGAADIVWPRADTIVWLDMPRVRTTWRVLKRTVRRSTSREELWNGNRESIWSLFKTDPEDNIVLWAWTRHGHYRSKYGEAIEDGTWGHADVRRLSADSGVEQFLGDLGSD